MYNSKKQGPGSAHSRLLNYMMGWKKGAGSSAFTDEQMKDKDFSKGYEDGRADSKSAYVKACKAYKAVLSPIRAMNIAKAPIRK